MPCFISTVGTQSYTAVMMFDWHYHHPVNSDLTIIIGLVEKISLD
jgi:hypothetical protein